MTDFPYKIIITTIILPLIIENAFNNMQYQVLAQRFKKNQDTRNSDQGKLSVSIRGETG